MIKDKPRVLEETRIWEKYNELTKDPDYYDRKYRVIKIYELSRDLLSVVNINIPNYTLHNERHIVNVLNAMSGILGDAIDKLSIQELEVLIIVASLHDVGMAYTDDQIKEAFTNSIQIERFLKERHPSEYELDPNSWNDNTKQDYLRYLHPFRVKEIISDEYCKEIFYFWPHDMAGIDIIVEICQAHGMTLEEIENNEKLTYFKAKDVDALFCAMLLRLADLLDFDDSRAPSVLFNYAKDNENSRYEFEKHMATGGFLFKDRPSEEDLPYYVICSSPNMEYAIKTYLDWIDEELQNCRYLRSRFSPQWKSSFSFPRKVSREEFVNDGFLSGEYSLKLDFERTLKLISGEELYSQKDIFVRELLQNAIDATLLRGKMDSSFCVEEAPIEMWEWTDPEGRWFRIDDSGTGMTLNMVLKYFLSVGNSYYASQELKSDLIQHSLSNKRKYTAISKFGIGFLSCFLCGSVAEISTLYFDEDKCRKEYRRINRTTQYGIRLKMGQSDSLYAIRCQAYGHKCPTRFPSDKEDKYGSEYRNKYGTSVVIKLDPSKLEGTDIKESIEKIICGTRMPIFYNGKRIGKTRREIIDEYSKLANCKITIGLSEPEKLKFNQAFPELNGAYPLIKKEYHYFDSKTEMNIDGFTEIVETISVSYDQNKEVFVRGVPCKLKIINSNSKCGLVLDISDMDNYLQFEENESFRRERRDKKTQKRITVFFDTCDSCPSFLELGDLAVCFSNQNELEYEWRVYIRSLLGNYSWIYEYDHTMFDEMKISYKGIVQGIEDINSNYMATSGLLLLDDDWRPSMNVARTEIISLPLEVNVLLSYLSIDFDNFSTYYTVDYLDESIYSVDMYHWREFMRSELGVWLIKRIKKHLHPNSDFYRALVVDPYLLLDDTVMRIFVEAYCLDNYRMKVSFSSIGTIIKATKKIPTNESECEYGVLPPMMFCNASNEYSKKIVCEGDPNYRFAINRDHFFINWFIENASILKNNYNSIYMDILYALKEDTVDSILLYVKRLALQIDKYGSHGDISSDIPKKLKSDDFPFVYDFTKLLKI